MKFQNNYLNSCKSFSSFSSFHSFNLIPFLSSSLITYSFILPGHGISIVFQRAYRTASAQKSASTHHCMSMLGSRVRYPCAKFFGMYIIFWFSVLRISAMLLTTRKWVSPYIRSNSRDWLILCQDLVHAKQEIYLHLNLLKAVRLSSFTHMVFQNHLATWNHNDYEDVRY